MMDGQLFLFPDFAPCFFTIAVAATTGAGSIGSVDRAKLKMDEAVWKAFQNGDFDDMLDKLALPTMNFRHINYPCNRVL
jgi:hypothetical protein